MKSQCLLFAVLLGASWAFGQQATLTLAPATITACNVWGLGRATVSWRYSQTDEEVQVRVTDANGTPFTGWAPASGSADTGDWVRDGLVFVLVDRNGRELARTQAIVRCAEPSAADSYFPLQVGNIWVYRYNDRSITSDYVTWRVTGTEQNYGQPWYVVAPYRYRTDGYGRIYRIAPGASGPQLWLDPSPQPDPGALLTVQARGMRFVAPLGSFPDSLSYHTWSSSLISEGGTFARGLGLVAQTSDMATGSSGGFFTGLELVYAKVGDRLLSTAMASIDVAAEKQTLDVTGKQVTNCAVPCYFVACYLMPGADPPDTYKPCFQVRVRLTDPTIAASAGTAALKIELLDGQDRAVWQVTRKFESPDAEQVLYQQIPLYSAPDQPLPAGAYRVRATPQGTASAGGSAATIGVRVQ